MKSLGVEEFDQSLGDSVSKQMMCTDTLSVLCCEENQLMYYIYFIFTIVLHTTGTSATSLTLSILVAKSLTFKSLTNTDRDIQVNDRKRVSE